MPETVSASNSHAVLIEEVVRLKKDLEDCQRLMRNTCDEPGENGCKKPSCLACLREVEARYKKEA